VREPAICDACTTHECIRGSATAAGCQTQLFQPQKFGNLDCTYCLDCTHACPHGNVGVLAAIPTSTLWLDRVRSGIGRFSRRPDLAALVVLVVFGAFANAAGMIEPVVVWQDRLRFALDDPSPIWITTASYFLALVALPLLCVTLAAYLSKRWSRLGDSTTANANRFVFVGRLSPEKDFDTLFGAVAKLPTARLDIIGDGPLLPRLRVLANAAQVTFHGGCDRDVVDEHLRRSRGLILCSTVEGLPNAVLEALSQGCPVIGTAVGAIPELLTDAVNGYLVQPGDQEAIAEAMRKLQDDQRWLSMAAQARQSVERFAWSQLVPAVELHLEALRNRVSPTHQT